MTLLLHCGYHKTGSSYLQSCFANQTALLGRHGIFYPDDPRQEDAAQGIPTAGNGAEVAAALLDSDGPSCLQHLKNYATQARDQAATSVLLSTEGFFSAFTMEGGLQQLTQLAGKAGFADIRALIFFRDPVDHAISVYCHRAASGKMPAFPEWLEKQFETPAMMRTFAMHHASFPIQWLFRRFQPKIDDIATVAFADWLQLAEIPDLSTLPAQVNVSISITESELLREFHARHPGCGRHLSSALKTLTKGQKASESALRCHYENVATAYFQKHQETLGQINQLLPANQQLLLAPPVADPSAAVAPLFTSAQVIACAEGLQAFHCSRTLAGRFQRFVQRTRRQFVRRFFS